MLTQQQVDFIAYWEKNKDVQNTFNSKLIRGLPMASVFCLPILLLVLFIYLYVPDWYFKISKTSGSSFFVVIIAVLIATVFYAFVRMHFKWEMNDNLYKQLKQKQKKDSLMQPLR